MRFQIKLHKGKILPLIVISSFVVLMVLFLSLDNRLERQQRDLEIFYKASFVESKIYSVDELPYRRGKGTYKRFRVDNKSISFPVLLDALSRSKTKYFEKGAIINKKNNSLYLLITLDGDEHEIKLKDPKTEDNRKSDISVMVTFFGFVILVILFFPNSAIQEFIEKQKY